MRRVSSNRRLISLARAFIFAFGVAASLKRATLYGDAFVRASSGSSSLGCEEDSSLNPVGVFRDLIQDERNSENS